MKLFWTTVIAVLLSGTAMFVFEQQSLPDYAAVDKGLAVLPQKSIIRASGQIKGHTEEIELRARIREQITEVRVFNGQWVTKGTVLVCLDPLPFTQQRNLADALLSVEIANRDRLENGFRLSERETHRNEYEAMLARLDRAEKSYARGVQLANNKAISEQALDELASELKATRALAAAAKGRLETVQLPAREDEMMAASGAVRAAQTRLEIAQLNLDHTQITAPIDGQIVAIEAEVGELAGPDTAEPLVVIADTKNLRVMAEIDEFDALRVQCGQLCEIRSDAAEGVLASGHVTEIEPRMNPKRMYGQWAGERTDTSALRVWIELDDYPELPIGLPVDVFIQAPGSIELEQVLENDERRRNPVR